ncbi:hypothetical protein [Larkinella ripae]
MVVQGRILAVSVAVFCGTFSERAFKLSAKEKQNRGRNLADLSRVVGYFNIFPAGPSPLGSAKAKGRISDSGF